MSRRRSHVLPLVAVSVASLALAASCSDDQADPTPAGNEAGEENTEIVPGEEGPVD